MGRMACTELQCLYKGFMTISDVEIQLSWCCVWHHIVVILWGICFQCAHVKVKCSLFKSWKHTEAESVIG